MTPQTAVIKLTEINSCQIEATFNFNGEAIGIAILAKSLFQNPDSREEFTKFCQSVVVRHLRDICPKLKVIPVKLSETN